MADDLVNPAPARVISAAFPPKLIEPLLESRARYVVLHGGRGGAKSWSVARALLIRAANAPLRILCCREYMSSVADSQHKLLVDQIHELGLSDRFNVEKATIYGLCGSEFRFAGIRNNPDTVRSFEGVDVAWVEEAASCTRKSWETLIPTIRKENSQIIITFNPILSTDETYQRFVVSPPPSANVVRINYVDNPFCPQVLLEEARYLQESDPDAYQNVWLGHPRVTLANAVYASELRQCQESGRITKVPYDEFAPVHAFYDLGWRDSTSIILAQSIGHEYHIIDFVQGNKRSISDYLRQLQGLGYVYGTHYLPFDGGAKSLQTGRSVEQLIRAHGFQVRVMPKLSIADGINAARQIFGRCWFDQHKTADLLQCLRNYQWDEEHRGKLEPLHDENSHAADAFRLMALSIRSPSKRPERHPFEPEERPSGWMM